MNKQPIKDDNLRLVLAAGHEKWLEKEACHHRISLYISGGLLALNGLTWLVTLMWQDMAASYFAIAVFLCFLSPIWFIIFGKAVYELRKVVKWRKEHRDFLAQYNRTPADYYKPTPAMKMAA